MNPRPTSQALIQGLLIWVRALPPFRRKERKDGAPRPEKRIRFCRPYGAEILVGMLSQGFTLGYFRFTPPGLGRGYSAWKTMSKSRRLAVVKMMS
jgi:hypothetical protein